MLRCDDARMMRGGRGDAYAAMLPREQMWICNGRGASVVRRPIAHRPSSHASRGRWAGIVWHRHCIVTYCTVLPIWFLRRGALGHDRWPWYLRCSQTQIVAPPCPISPLSNFASRCQRARGRARHAWDGCHTCLHLLFEPSFASVAVATFIANKGNQRPALYCAACLLPLLLSTPRTLLPCPRLPRCISRTACLPALPCQLRLRVICQSPAATPSPLSSSIRWQHTAHSIPVPSPPGHAGHLRGQQAIQRRRPRQAHIHA